MEKSKIDLFAALNAENFPATTWPSIREKLETMDENQFMIIQCANFRSPTIILLIAIFLGWDRFFLDDIGLGILKVLTCYGFSIWWIVDIFTAADRTKAYNYRKFIQLTQYPQ